MAITVTIPETRMERCQPETPTAQARLARVLLDEAVAVLARAGTITTPHAMAWLALEDRADVSPFVPAHRLPLSYGDVGLVDGGIWANNPIALAVTEAIGVLGWSSAALSILSLGCLEEVYSVPKGGGIGTLGKKAIGLFMDGQSHGAMGMAKILTGDVYQRKAIYRIDHHMPYSKYRMDDTRVITDLKGLGHVKGRDQFPHLSDVFFRMPAEPFEPIYTLEPLQQKASKA